MLAGATVTEAFKAWVRAASRGDELAFRRLYEAHVGRVRALVRRLGGPSAPTDEWVQEVFVRAFEGIEGFRGESSFATWLQRIAIHVALGHQRRKLRLDLRGAATEVDARAVEPVGGARLELERALARLPTGARTVLVLFDVEGHTHEEIASLLQISVGTSKAQLFRARRLMREALA